VIAGDGANVNLVVWSHGNDAVPLNATETNATITLGRRSSGAHKGGCTIRASAYLKDGSEASKQLRSRAANVRKTSRVSLMAAAGMGPSQQESLGNTEERDTRSTPVTPPAYLVANPLVVSPVATSSSSSSKGDGHSDTWVGGIIGLVFITIAVLITGLAVAILLVVVIYKYREPIKERLSHLGDFKLPRGDNFKQFTDEDEVPGL